MTGRYVYFIAPVISISSYRYMKSIINSRGKPEIDLCNEGQRGPRQRNARRNLSAAVAYVPTALLKAPHGVRAQTAERAMGTSWDAYLTK